MVHGSWLAVWVRNGGSALLPGQGPAPAPMDDARAGVVWGRLDDAQMSSCFAAASSLQFALAPCTYQVCSLSSVRVFFSHNKTTLAGLSVDFNISRKLVKMSLISPFGRRGDYGTVTRFTFAQM